jgi:voltage-gated sodium channel
MSERVAASSLLPGMPSSETLTQTFDERHLDMEIDLVTHSPLGRVVEAKWFKALSFALIIASAAILGFETSPSVKESYGPILETIEHSIVWLFALELVLRIAAHGRLWPKFFLSAWNNFDFIVVVLCFLPAVGSLSAVARLARVLRALRLVSFLPNLQLLIEALLKSFASMGYVALLLSMVFYVYGVVGVGLFGAVDSEHFGSLGAACLTLFQVLTLEGWVDVMNPHREMYPMGAPLYFLSFILLGTMIVLNLFIGVIVNGMEEAQTEILLEKARQEGDHIQDAIRGVEEQLAKLRSIVERDDIRSTTNRSVGSSPSTRIKPEVAPALVE